MPVVSTTTAIGGAKLAGYTGAIAIFNYLNIPEEQIGILGILMIIDFATGIGKQYRIDREGITSHGAWIGVMKKLATMTSVLSVAFVLKGVNLESNGYLDSILAILIMAEGYSIIQNVYAIRTGKILPEFDVVSIMLKHVSDFLKHKIENSIKDDTENSKK